MLLELSRLRWGQLIQRPIGQLGFPFTASHDVHLFCVGVGKAVFRIRDSGKRRLEIRNWKFEIGNWQLVASASFHFLVSIFFPVQFSVSDFRPAVSWLVNLDSGVFGGCSVWSFSDFWILTPDFQISTPH
jgi:hypothetical protein